MTDGSDGRVSVSSSIFQLYPPQFQIFLSNLQLFIKLFYIINTVDHIHMKMICNCIYIYEKLAVYGVNGKTNLHIDIRNLILINMCLVLLITNSLIIS